MEIDHIIPVRQYILAHMYKLYSQAHSASLAEMTAEVNRLYWDPENLVCVCRLCNNRKSKKMPDKAVGKTPSYLDRLIKSARDSASKKKYEALKKTMQATRTQPVAIRRFLIGDLMLKKTTAERAVSSGSSGVSPSFSIYDMKERRDYTERGAKPSVTAALRFASAEVAENIDVLIRNKIGGKPNLRNQIGEAQVQELQDAYKQPVTQKKDLRICLYCLGLFMDTAFQIEHIKAIRRSATKYFDKKEYNDNLIAICRSCNGSRNSRALTLGLLQDLIDEREKQNLPAADKICEDLADAAQRHIHTILGF
ncbi:HNH endonuclease [Salipiger abyssi]|uniref:HNH endonuclease n=1 Tax=Salipiger abyssi TaxID=1250539 RepID=UPI001A8CA020|nr:HNH endonuclease [Salipiger abyssi]MBN9888855.1 HNH endonuclease [Salipiger abyssi]